MTKPNLNIGEQIALLLEVGIDSQGKSYSLSRAALAAGLSDQTLLNLVSGKAQMPRLDTLRALCRLYGISLDYFDLDTEGECRAFLAQHYPQTVKEIDHLSRQLSPKGQRNILAILSWIKTSAGKRPAPPVPPRR